MTENPVENLITETEQVVEELFTPKPGGIIWNRRQEQARRKAAQDEAEHVSEGIEHAAYRAVKVAPESPEVVSAYTVTIQPQAVGMILPNSPYRYRSVLNVITISGQVVLSKDGSAALGGVGYPLNNDRQLQLYTRGQVWGYNPNVSAVTVAVISEMYAPES